jgi:hypothetical protein
MDNIPLLKSKSLNLIIPLILYSAFTYLFIYLILELLPPIFDTKAYSEVFHWPPTEQVSMRSFLKSWDGHHYLALSESGYYAGLPSAAFYPLWPLLIRYFSYLTGGDHLVAGLILANIFSIAGLVLFHYFVLCRHGESIADIALLFLLAYPGSIFFSFIYTEPLFFLLSITFFIFLFRSDYLKAGIVSILLPCTKVIGVFSILPFLLHIFLKKGVSKSLLFTLFPIAGFLLYLLYMYLMTGNPFEGFEMQRKNFITNSSFSKLFDVISFVKLGIYPFIDGTLKLHDVKDSAMDRLFFLWFLVSLIFMWRKDKNYFVYALAVGLSQAILASYMSFTRYLLMVFPVFIVTAEYFANEDYKYVRWVLLIALSSIKILFLIRHVNNYWAG